MGNVKRQSRCELVAEGIKQLILDGRLKPLDRLPTEHQLAERFGVSRVAVREATKALSFLGIIRAAPRRGLSVGKVDMHRVAEYLGFHLALDDYPKKQLWQTRFIIETGALPYVAQAMADEGGIFDRLEALLEVARRADDLAGHVASDIAFHRALLEASGIGPLLAFDDLLQIFFNHFKRQQSPQRWMAIVDEHHALLRHLRDGELENARRLLSAHLNIYDADLDS
jgi:GntR family transcriptional repressor for pyruvate dehydrogenase complex